MYMLMDAEDDDGDVVTADHFSQWLLAAYIADDELALLCESYLFNMHVR